MIYDIITIIIFFRERERLVTYLFGFYKIIVKLLDI
jgi:hypothetical protein